ncbi:MAG: HAD-IIIA family hydrolase [Bacteroidetes bacterium]|nr:HAD-IIIA family hydrolase [Bacteroidota bacterium]
MINKKPAIFLDRDGVINSVDKRQGMSPRLFEDFKIFPNVKEALEAFRNLGFLNLVLTNQPDIARGLMTLSELDKMNKLLRNEFPVDDIMVCPHDDADNCKCRKPKPGMLFDLVSKWNVDLTRSFFIGDSLKDFLVTERVKVRFIYIKHRFNEELENITSVTNLNQAVNIVSSKLTLINR